MAGRLLLALAIVTHCACFAPSPPSGQHRHRTQRPAAVPADDSASAAAVPDRTAFAAAAAADALAAEAGLRKNARTPFSLLRCDDKQACVWSEKSTREFVDSPTNSIAYRGTASIEVAIMWDKPPSTCLLLVKRDDPHLQRLAALAAEQLAARNLRVLCEPAALDAALAAAGASPFVGDRDKSDVDFIVTLGGDGLLIHASLLFGAAVPPVLCFALGSLGFLTPFDFDESAQAVGAVVAPGAIVPLSLRMRLLCALRRRDGTLVASYSVLNEVAVDRGASPFLSNLDVDVDDRRFTTVQADGVIVSTPTGSTAYSMSAGGSVVHPGVPAILLTPVCPHSLSCRPVVLPDSATIRLQLADEPGAADAAVAFDGKFRTALEPGDYLEISMSPHPLPTICRRDTTSDWFDSLDNAFSFNRRVAQKPKRAPGPAEAIVYSSGLEKGGLRVEG